MYGLTSPLYQAALTGSLAICTIATPSLRSPRRLVMHFSQVLPQLFIGSCPTNTDDIDYYDLDWGRIESRCNELGIAVRRIPVRAFDGEDLRRKLSQCVQALDKLLKNGQTVYTHCNVGMGRSPSVAILLIDNIVPHSGRPGQGQFVTDTPCRDWG
jgi:protein-tyrosine phosphatase